MKKIYYIIKIYKAIKEMNVMYTIEDSHEDAVALCNLLNKYCADNVCYKIVSDDISK